MAVSYSKLWNMLKSRNMTKKELMRRAGISSATVSTITHNREVSMATLISICKALNCDIGDIVSLSTNEEQAHQSSSEYIKQLNRPEIIKEAIEMYLNNHQMSKNTFCKITGISINTLARLLEEKKANLSTYKKIMSVMSTEIMQCIENYWSELS